MYMIFFVLLHVAMASCQAPSGVKPGKFSKHNDAHRIHGTGIFSYMDG